MHVGSPDWQEAAAEGRGARKMQMLSSCSPSLPWLLGMPSSVELSVSSAKVRRRERAGKARVKQRGLSPSGQGRWR